MLSQTLQARGGCDLADRPHQLILVDELQTTRPQTLPQDSCAMRVSQHACSQHEWLFLSQCSNIDLLSPVLTTTVN